MGQFTLTIPGSGSSFAPGENGHPQGKGHCEGTVWYNPQGKRTSAKFCEGVEGGTTFVTCTIDQIAATYAAAGNNPGSGNENLNFLTEEEGAVEDLFVHYRANGQTTSAKGSVPLTYSCDDDSQGGGRLDLGQWNGAGLFFVAGRGHPVASAGGQVDPGWGRELSPLTELNWTFRSRVGS
jgi:hypothetical protein